MKKIAVINDISGFGKCSLTAAIPIISSHKMQCCPLVSGVFSNQTGYDSFKYADMTEHMQGFIEEWKKLGANFDAIITGFISNPKQVKIINDFIGCFKKEETLLVVDPVMADDGETYKGFNKEKIDAVCSLAKEADIITPNISELCILENESFDDIKGEKALSKAERLAKCFYEKNKVKLVITGIEISEKEIATAAFDGKSFQITINEKIGKSFSGTGDILCATLTCELLEGRDLFASTEYACNFINKAIRKTTEKEHINYADGIDFEYFL